VLLFFRTSAKLSFQKIRSRHKQVNQFAFSALYCKCNRTCFVVGYTFACTPISSSCRLYQFNPKRMFVNWISILLWFYIFLENYNFGQLCTYFSIWAISKLMSSAICNMCKLYPFGRTISWGFYPFMSMHNSLMPTLFRQYGTLRFFPRLSCLCRLTRPW
jgi:hypothetical protein